MAQPCCGGGATGGRRLDVEPWGYPRLGSRCGWYRCCLQAEEGVGHPAGIDDLISDGYGQIDRNGKTQADAAADRVRHCRAGCRHPDQLTLTVDQSTAAV